MRKISPYDTNAAKLFDEANGEARLHLASAGKRVTANVARFYFMQGYMRGKQAAQGRKVELPKVREALECAESRLRCLLSEVFTSNFTDRYEDGPACKKTLFVVQQGIAGLDAAQGRER